MIEQNELICFLVALNVVIVYLFKRNYILHLMFMFAIPIYILSCEIVEWFQIFMLLFVFILNAMSIFYIWKEIKRE